MRATDFPDYARDGHEKWAVTAPKMSWRYNLESVFAGVILFDSSWTPAFMRFRFPWIHQLDMRGATPRVRAQFKPLIQHLKQVLSQLDDSSLTLTGDNAADVRQNIAAMVIGWRSSAYRLAQVLDVACEVARTLELTYNVRDALQRLARNRVLPFVREYLRDLETARAEGLSPELAETRARQIAAARAQDRIYQLNRDFHLLGDLGHESSTVPVRDLTRDLDHKLTRAHDLAHELTRSIAHTHELTRDIDLGRDLTRVRKIGVEVESAHGLAHELTLHIFSRDHIGARIWAWLIANMDRESTSILARELLRIRDLAHEFARDLDHADVDASGADLSHLEIDDLDVLTGLIWTARTIWPPGLADQIRLWSQEINPGIYQVRRGTVPNRMSNAEDL